MSVFRPLARALALALCAATVLPAQAGALADIQVIDRDSGERLRQYHHRGRIYVAGTPGNRYEVQIRNQLGERLLAVMSVDGVNVLNGATASTGQGGYVFAPWEHDSIRGWRKSLNDIAQFHFTALPNSYAARTGRPDNVGVIGVALYREQAPRMRRHDGPFLEDGQQRFEEEERDDGYDGRYGKSGRAESDAAAPQANDAPAAEQAAPPSASRKSAPKSAPKLGTGHGQREYDPTHTTAFQRATERPEEVITIYYDSRANLVARGIVPKRRHSYRRQPEAFPGEFTPDP